MNYQALTHIAHHASLEHGMTCHVSHRDHTPYNAYECAAMCDTDRDTRSTLRWMVERGYLDVKTRTRDFGPPSAASSWPEMDPQGVTTLRTWHPTEAGREAWLENSW